MRMRPASPDRGETLAAYRRLWRGRAVAKAAIAEAISLALLLQLARMLPALGLALVIDKVATSHAEATLIAILSALALAAGLEHQLAAGREAVAKDIADRIEADISAEQDAGEPMRRCSASPDSVARIAAELLLITVTLPPMGGMMILVLVLACPPLALLAVGATAVNVAVDRLGRRARGQRSAAVRTASQALERWRAHSGATLLVDGDDRTREEARRRDVSLAAALRRDQDTLEAIRRAQGRIGTLLQRVGYVAALGLGAHAIAAGALTTGGLIAALMILRQVETLVATSLATLHRAEATAPGPAHRTPSDRSAAPSDTPPCGGIALRDAVLRFDDRAAPALRASLDISPNSFVVVTGAAGSGKSLLLRLIAGALPPQGGAVLRAPALIAPLAFVGDDPLLPDSTIAETVHPGATTAAHAMRLEALRLVDAFDAVRALPHGLSQRTGPGGRALSSTLRRRIALARALAAQPRVLLIDALPDRLDAGSAARLLAALTTLRGRVTLVVATERPEWHAAADRRIVLRDGRVIADGPEGQPRIDHVRSA